MVERCAERVPLFPSPIFNKHTDASRSKNELQVERLLFTCKTVSADNEHSEVSLKLKKFRGEGEGVPNGSLTGHRNSEVMLRQKHTAYLTQKKARAAKKAACGPGSLKRESTPGVKMHSRKFRFSFVCVCTVKRTMHVQY